jgi:hypothetical protein
MLHSPPQWRGWVSPRELAEQHRGVIPRRVMARLCHVRALNARTRMREQVRVRGNPRARRSPLEGVRALERGGTRSRKGRALDRGGTRSREVLALERGRTRSREAFALERGGTCSRGPLIGPLQWSAGTIAAWSVPCVRV